MNHFVELPNGSFAEVQGTAADVTPTKVYVDIENGDGKIYIAPIPAECIAYDDVQDECGPLVTEQPPGVVGIWEPKTTDPRTYKFYSQDRQGEDRVHRVGQKPTKPPVIINISVPDMDAFVHRQFASKVFEHQKRDAEECLAKKDEVIAIHVGSSKTRDSLPMIGAMAAFASINPAALRMFGRYKSKQTTWAPCTSCGNDCRTGKCFKCQQKSK